MTPHHYVGSELDLFARAVNWKKYWSSEVRKYLSGDVLEVGAGLGANTEYLRSDRAASWLCLEPDPALAARMRDKFASEPFLRDFKVQTGTTEMLGSQPQFDTILYIDVLEHIENDREELARASDLLRTSGTIVVLAPAHQWLYTPFDRAIGHVRRYDKTGLSSRSPGNCQIVRMAYLDAAGILASMGNQLFLRHSQPELRQILFWDRVLIPVSKWLDRLTLHGIGKSILCVWRKCADTSRDHKTTLDAGRPT